jgi:succinate-acetate transporter protein
MQSRKSSVGPMQLQGKQNNFIEPIGMMVGAIAGIFSFLLFYSHTDNFGGSLFGALISAAWFWMTYLILRWLVMAFK